MKTWTPRSRQRLDQALASGTVKAWDEFLALERSGPYAELAQRERERLVAITKTPGATNPAGSGIAPLPQAKKEREVPGWRVQLYPKMIDGTQLTGTPTGTKYYLNGMFDFIMNDNREDRTAYSYQFDGIFRATEPGNYLFGVYLRCNLPSTVSRCEYVARADDEVKDQISGQAQNGTRRAFRVLVNEPREIRISLIYSGEYSRVAQVKPNDFSMTVAVRAPSDREFRDFRQLQPPYELFVRAPLELALKPRYPSVDFAEYRQSQQSVNGSVPQAPTGILPNIGPSQVVYPLINSSNGVKWLISTFIDLESGKSYPMEGASCASNGQIVDPLNLIKSLFPIELPRTEFFVTRMSETNIEITSINHLVTEHYTQAKGRWVTEDLQRNIFVYVKCRADNTPYPVERSNFAVQAGEFLENPLAK